MDCAPAMDNEAASFRAIESYFAKYSYVRHQHEGYAKEYDLFYPIQYVQFLLHSICPKFELLHLSIQGAEPVEVLDEGHDEKVHVFSNDLQPNLLA